MITYGGEVRAPVGRIGIVVSRFNDFVTGRLLEGARACLLEHGAREADIEIAWVPGAWELPLGAQRLVRTRRCCAVIALGCVVRGDTPHFDYVAGAAATGLESVSARLDVPVGFGVLTTDTMEQALARAGGRAGNKGWETALAVLEMLDLVSSLEAAGEP
jgi:6,7-dimethyl-8-ribityllumazine synthase